MRIEVRLERQIDAVAPCFVEHRFQRRDEAGRVFHGSQRRLVDAGDHDVGDAKPGGMVYQPAQIGQAWLCNHWVCAVQRRGHKTICTDTGHLHAGSCGDFCNTCHAVSRHEGVFLYAVEVDDKFNDVEAKPGRDIKLLVPITSRMRLVLVFVLGHQAPLHDADFMFHLIPLRFRDVGNRPPQPAHTRYGRAGCGTPECGRFRSMECGCIRTFAGVFRRSGRSRRRI